MSERVPAEAFHISEFIQDEMNARGWSRDDVYERLGYDARDCLAFDLMMDVKDKDILMSRREDQALQDVFGITDPGFFTRLYDAWRVHPSTVTTVKSNVVILDRNNH